MDREPIAPRNVLMQMIAGFQVSQAIYVAAALGIADLLADGPRSVDDLAEVAEAHPATLYRLLRALASADIFEERDGLFGLTPLAQYLRSDVPNSARAWVLHLGQPYFWTTWGHLLYSVRTGEPAFHKLYGTNPWEYRAHHPEENAIFNAAMASLSADVVDAVVGSYDFSGIDVLADIGGGTGSLLAAVLAANPTLRGILFDQPHVVASAKPMLERAGVAERCEIVSGSFFDSVPGGADAYLLKSIIHDWDDAEAIAILSTCRRAMGDRSRLLLIEPVIQPGNDPDPSKFSDLNMLVMLGGRERTADHFKTILAESGFTLTRIIPTESRAYVVEAIAT